MYDPIVLCGKGLYDPVFPCDKGLYDPVFPILDIKNTLYALPFIFIVPTTILRKLNLEVEVNQRYSKKFVDFSKAKRKYKMRSFRKLHWNSNFVICKVFCKQMRKIDKRISKWV